MFIILLKFSANKSKAPEWMAKHNEWLGRGFADGVFIMAGSIKPGLGGAIIARGGSLTGITNRVNDDPFVIEDVVKAEILEISPSKVIDQMKFLNENSV